MKYKVLIVIVLIFLISCKASVKTCPAYGIPATPFKKY